MREKGLEPLRLSALEPKSSVYTSFTTLATITQDFGFCQADIRVTANEPSRIRTLDPQIKSLLLYQLS